MSKSSGDQLWTLKRSPSVTGTPAMSPTIPLPSWLRGSGRHEPSMSTCASVGTLSAKKTSNDTQRFLASLWIRSEYMAHLPGIFNRFLESKDISAIALASTSGHLLELERKILTARRFQMFRQM